MQVTQVIDIEEALRVDLSAVYEAGGKTGFSFSATPIPPELGEIPLDNVLVCIRRVGGTRNDLVVDTHSVAIDVYTTTWEEGISEADFLAGVISQLPYQSGMSIQYLTCSIATTPYELPDAENPIFPRVRMLVEIEAKASIIDF